MKTLRLLAVGIAALAMPCVGLANATVESVTGEVLALLDVFSSADQALWYDMYKSGQLPSSAV